ncbi:NADP-dependent oxidoreductase [Saccharopolyspora gloriosae]|uniref:NADP-dependent oxidoreductase n=1 Tax=Saccharopolyspora gloriosae TaxID=455344 RepID=UPI001FB7B7FF|nr:NADP-dependent oxidoreductase [Saccharopolyspora gloriosae]
MTTQGLPDTGIEIRLASRPNGFPTQDNFDITEAPVTAPGEGQILVRNKVMSVDPAMRGRMNDVKSYVPPFQLGKPLDGGAVGEVIASNSPDYEVGQHVLHYLGWREYATVDAKRAVPVDADAAPLNAYLGVLGMPGMTAYVGLFEIARFKEGDTVFVSGAAGAVGSLVGQLAKQAGAAKVIGSAGSAEKVRHITEDLGFDAAFNYKDGPVREQLAQAAPDGIDVYFDNVGGDHLEAALDEINDFGRIAACGAISVYNDTDPSPGPRNMFKIVKKRLNIRGFIVIDHADLREKFQTDVAPLVRDGKIHYTETVTEGLRNAPDAFFGLLQGKNTGKMLVTV